MEEQIAQVNWVVVGAIATVAAAAIGALAGFFGASIRVGQYIQKVDDLKDRMDKAEVNINDNKCKTIEVATKLEERTGWSPAALTRRKSPLSLSEKGEELLQKSGADKFVSDHTKELVDAIKSKNPKTAYDVQTISKEVVEKLKDREDFIPFKNFAFREGLELEPIFIVMSIFLRDVALPFLNFKYDGLDKTDPTWQQKS